MSEARAIRQDGKREASSLLGIRPLQEADQLLTIPLFRGLPDETLEEIRSRTVLQRFQKGETIVSGGVPWDSLLMLLEGKVQVIHQRLGQLLQVIDEFGPGRPLMVVPALDGLPSPCCLVATASGEYLRVPGEVLRDVIRKHGEVGLHLLECLCRRTRTLAQLVGTLSLLTLEERVVLYLLRHAPVKDPGFAGASRSWDMNQEQLGRRIGGSREEVTRHLGKLRKSGLIRIGRRRVEILDYEGLRSIAPEIPQLKII